MVRTNHQVQRPVSAKTDAEKRKSTIAVTKSLSVEDKRKSAIIGETVDKQDNGIALLR